MKEEWTIHIRAYLWEENVSFFALVSVAELECFPLLFTCLQAYTHISCIVLQLFFRYCCPSLSFCWPSNPLSSPLCFRNFCAMLHCIRICEFAKIFLLLSLGLRRILLQVLHKPFDCSNTDFGLCRNGPWSLEELYQQSKQSWSL